MTFEWDERKNQDNINKHHVSFYTEASENIARAITTGETVVDFLPPPEKLVRKEPKVKITIALNSGSVDFFKNHAQKNNVKYQTMINEVLDGYARKYGKRLTV